MLASLGDLVSDVVVILGGPLQLASDTTSVIRQRRGGSAANVVATAATHGYPTRFLGQVGADPIGGALLADLAALGVDVSAVVRAGATGTVVALVDDRGERHMLTDRGTAVGLSEAHPSWLNDASVLHVPLYAWATEPMATSASTLVGWAVAAGIPVSIDLASVALIETLSPARVVELLHALEPTVVFANADESAALDARIDAPIVVIKHGGDHAIVRHVGHADVAIEAVPLANVTDTTGAGDAFAAGFLTHPAWRTDPVAACVAAHAIAAHHLGTR